MTKNFITGHIHVASAREAWQEVNKIFPSDYEQDADCSRRAGYPVYWSTRPGCMAWISDLGDRLEVNLDTGDTVNVWIDPPAAAADPAPAADDVGLLVQASEIAKRASFEALYTPEICQRVTICIDGDPWSSDDEKTLYRAIKAGGATVGYDIMTRYAETHGIPWGCMTGISCTHYKHPGGGGHYIVSCYISGGAGREIEFLASCADAMRKAAEARR